MDARDEILGYRMRESQTRKIPFTLVIGDKEIETNSVNYRVHGTNETVTLSVDDFVKLIHEKNADYK